MAFPWIKQKCESGELNIHGWYFDMETGSLLSKQGETFLPVDKLLLK